MKNILPIILLALSMSSCSYKQINLISMNNVKIKNVSKSGIDMSIDARIENPNNYNIHVKSSDLDVALANKIFGKARVKPTVKLKKNSTLTYPVSIHINYKPLAGGIMQTIPSLVLQKSVTTSVKGKLKGRVFLFTKKFDIDEQKKLDLSGGLKGILK